MEDTNTLQAAREAKIKELQAQEAKLKELQAELVRLNSKVENNEKLSPEDTKFIGDLGWIAALSVSIASIASSI